MKFITFNSSDKPIIGGIILGWVLFVLVILSISIYFTQTQKANEVSDLKNQENVKINLIKNYITELFNDEISHIKELAQNPEVKLFETTKRVQKNLIDTLINFEKNRKDYDEVTIIDINGQEKIKLKYNNGEPILANDLDLKNIKDSFYFKDSKDLMDTEVYITYIDLNKDDKPMIRMISPIYQGKNKFGFLELSYIANGIFDSIDKLEQTTSSKVAVLNEYGYWLKGFKKGDEWKFTSINPNTWEKISGNDSTQLINGDGLYTSTTVRPYSAANMVTKKLVDGKTEKLVNSNDYFWKMVSLTSNETITAGGKRITQFILILDILSVIVISSLTIFLMVAVKKRAEIEKRNKSLNEVLTIINKILRHDLANIFSTIQYSAEVNFLDKSRQEIKKEILSFTSKGISSINEMRQLDGMIRSGDNMMKMKLSQILNEVVTGYKIKIDIEGDAVVLADFALKSVFTNIINNAIIHGKTDRILIKIFEKKKYIQINISDFGSGIPKEVKESLFNEGAKFGQTGAHGLGLYIVKQTILRYGGDISFEENVPQGTTFIIELPKIK